MGLDNKKEKIKKIAQPSGIWISVYHHIVRYGLLYKKNSAEKVIVKFIIQVKVAMEVHRIESAGENKFATRVTRQWKTIANSNSNKHIHTLLRNLICKLKMCTCIRVINKVQGSCMTLSM